MVVNHGLAEHQSVDPGHMRRNFGLRHTANNKGWPQILEFGQCAQRLNIETQSLARPVVSPTLSLTIHNHRDVIRSHADHLRETINFILPFSILSLAVKN